MKLTATQNEVVVNLHKRTPCEGEDTPLYIVTGEGGTGKSFVLRTFARGLAIRYLNGHPASETLPLVMPLQQFSGLAGDDLWKLLVELWVNWVNTLVKRQVFDVPRWLEPRLNNHPTILILDGVDEFMLNNPSIRPAAFRELIHDLRQRYRGTSRVSIVLGIRSDVPMFELMRDDADDVLEVKKLADDEARHHFPSAFQVIDELRRRNMQAPASGQDRAPGTAPTDEDTNGGDILRTPLILSALEGANVGVEDVTLPRSGLRTRSDVFDLALSAVLKKGKIVERFHDTTLQDWKTALGIIAMLFSAEHLGQISTDDLRQGCEKIIALWPEKRGGRVAQLKRAGALIQTEVALQVLLDRSVFVPLGENNYRFKHRLWQDYLFGLYFALCIRSINLQELRRVAFTGQAFAIGGEILAASGWTGVDEAFAAEVVEKMTKPYGQFVIGNMGGLIGNHFLPVQSSAMSVFRLAEANMPAPGKLTFIGGVGYRILRADPADQALRDHFVPILQQCLERGRRRSESKDDSPSAGPDILLASSSWCYLNAFALHFKDEKYRPNSPWPGLCLNHEQEREIIDGLLGERKDGQFVLPPPAMFKSVQFAYLAIQADLLEESYTRPISVIHYLYTLVLAYKHGVAIEEVIEKLPGILLDASPLGQLFLAGDLIQIESVYRHCQRLFAEAKAAKSFSPLPDAPTAASHE